MPRAFRQCSATCLRVCSSSARLALPPPLRIRCLPDRRASGSSGSPAPAQHSKISLSGSGRRLSRVLVSGRSSASLCSLPVSRAGVSMRYNSACIAGWLASSRRARFRIRTEVTSHISRRGSSTQVVHSMVTNGHHWPQRPGSGLALSVPARKKRVASTRARSGTAAGHNQVQGTAMICTSRW